MGGSLCPSDQPERSQCIDKAKLHTGSPLNRSQLIIVYDLLLATGGIQLVVVFLTALLSRRVRRTATWYTFIFSWIIHSISYLFLAGQQKDGDGQPSIGTCVAQTALIYSSPPFTAYATLIFIFQLYISISSDLSKEQLRQTEEYIHILLMLPALAFILVIFEILALIIRDPHSVGRDNTGMLCHLDGPEAASANSIIIGLCLIIVIYLEISSLRILLRNRQALKHIREIDPIAYGMVARLILFNVAPLALLVYEVVNIPFNDDKIPMSFCHIAYASLPNLAALTFGTQPDFMRVWMFWKKDSPPAEPEKNIARLA